MKNIFIIGGFKNCTSTLETTFMCEKNHDINFENEGPVILNDNHTILLIPFNTNLEKIYKSTYFQDINQPDYEYSPFHKNNGILKKFQRCHRVCGGNCPCVYNTERKNIIKNIDVKLLIEHYKKMYSFISTQPHTNNNIRFEFFNNKYGLSLDFNSKEIQVCHCKIKNKDRKIICFHIDNINNNFKQLVYEIYGEHKDIELKNENIGRTKWYGEKYKEFLDNFK